jgi:hypothetical protein
VTNVTDAARQCGYTDCYQTEKEFSVMTDDQITVLVRAIDPFSYTAANPAVVRKSDPEPIRGQVLDTGATDDIARVMADIDVAEKQLLAVFAIVLPVALALLSFPLWS